MEELLSQIVGYLRGMWRYRWWGLAFAWLVGIGGGFAVYTMPDRYESSARIFVDTQSVLRPLMSGLAVQPNIEQQVAILSRTLITRPNVEKLIAMADLEIEVRSPQQREALIEELTSDLKIQSAGRDNLFTLAYRDTQADRAQRVVQALVSLFVESGLVGKQQDSTTARRFIDEQIANYEQKLAEAENRLKEFRLRNMALLGGAGGDYVSQIGQIGAQIKDAQLALKEAENSRASLERQLSVEDPLLQGETGFGNAYATPELDGRIQTLRANLDALLLRYTELHPDVIGTKKVIAELESQRQGEIEARKGAADGQPLGGGTNPVYQQLKIALSDADAQVASLRARVSELAARQADLRSKAELIPQIEAEATQLNRDYDVHRRNYDSLVQRRESASLSVEMSSQGGITEFRVIDPPSLPSKPAAPNRLLLMPLVGLGALAAGLALTFFIAQVRPAFLDVKSLRDITGLPVLGTVSVLQDPERTRRERRGLFAFGGGVASFAAAVGVMTLLLRWLQG